jgi:hypothetical protein
MPFVPLGDAPGFKAGNYDPSKHVKPILEGATTLLGIKAKIAKAKEQDSKANRQQSSAGPEAPSAEHTPESGPQQPNHKADVWNAVARAKQSIKRNPDHFLAQRSKQGPSAPKTLQEVPKHAVGKAMTNYHRGQVQGAINRASSSIQFKNHG